MIPSSLLTEQPYRQLPGESKLLYCQREKAAGLFAALERCGLLESVPRQSNGKARRYYLNLPRPKEPNEL
ncbi:hypothetical protein [Faecalibacterium prausnitzii]|uniref:Uncharacterized protein n=1 Tax=Faecalibacterium prausnitzii TaxID=853 RepID=A0A329TPT4_9FIRM|nr:hypothetical protein [Faecalibacterium prausnitzii]RAW51847.1 hypothetical protein C4N25_00050 [Faecalibacterium prausnitzii]